MNNTTFRAYLVEEFETATANSAEFRKRYPMSLIFSDDPAIREKQEADHGSACYFNGIARGLERAIVALDAMLLAEEAAAKNSINRAYKLYRVVEDK